MSGSQAGVAHFVVSGEFLTEFVRDLVVEGSWEHASRILVEDLHGMTWDLAIQILSGKKRLVGTSDGPGVELADEAPGEADAYLERVRWAFAGRWRHGSRWYEPYAVVTSYGAKDGLALLKGAIPLVKMADDRVGRKPSLWSKERALFYADNPTEDLLHYSLHPDERGAEREMAVLFRACGAPPMWFSAARGPDDAVKQAVTARGHLEFRGAGSEREHEKYVRVKEAEATAEATFKAAKHGSAEPAQVMETQVDLKRARDDLEAERKYRRTLEGYRVKIAAQADAGLGWFEFDVPEQPADGWKPGHQAYRARVPRAPFECWALRKTAGRHLAPPWEQVCPSGLKMMMDDAMHTDWMVGGGLDIDRVYDDKALMDVAWKEMFKIQQERLNFKVHVLCGRGKVEGRVWHAKEGERCIGAIAVVPDAGPRWQEIADDSLAVITPVGGQLSHLAVVGLERQFKLVRIPDCFKLFPEGCEIVVDLENGEVRIPEFGALSFDR